MWKRTHFPRYAWGLLVYNLAVVIWGAYVRASFSGDGCGAHWPLCGGQAIPTDWPITKIVEFTHRLSSGLCLPFVLLLLVWAWRIFPKGHPARKAAVFAVAFTISEALVGAGLVRFQLVAHNPTVYRTVATCLHLTNTFVLLAALTLTAWWASGEENAPNPVPKNNRAPEPADRQLFQEQHVLLCAIGIGMIGTLILGITGTIAALGSMLYPSTSLIAGLKQDFAPTASYLIRLRPLHPMLAITVGMYLILLGALLQRKRPSPMTRRFARSFVGLFCFQLIVGFINLMLHAPVWLQLEHLLLADLLWINLVLLSATALAQNQARPEASTPEFSPRKGYAIR